MRKLSLADLQRHSIESFKDVPKLPLVVVLDNIRSMHNVGTFFRTGDAFAIEHLYLCGITAQPPHPEIHKTALGATEAVTWSHENDITVVLKKLKTEGYLILAIEQTDSSTFLQDYTFDVTKKYAIIFGNEISGVQSSTLEHCDTAIEIPQFGTKHSFNVSVTFGIVLWDFVRRRLIAEIK
ncbi:MAG: RNA methyltransferase [Cytophagaceae bacterium]|jgi:tRNA G18 (ribose-2'-O)-methylase SpoU|nr:RNA methyltransferase [Cytophagaceae bacterium]